MAILTQHQINSKARIAAMSSVVNDIRDTVAAMRNSQIHPGTTDDILELSQELLHVRLTTKPTSHVTKKEKSYV